MFGITLDTTLMMRRRAQPSSIASPGELVAIESPEDIVADCAATGRASSLERARMRADHGMRYFCLREEGRSIAGAWITHTRRFLDEAMLLFELGPGDACMRDVFVAPGRRGERVFSRLVAALVGGPLQGGSALWSCVDARNAASVHAHQRCGFESLSRIRTLSAAGWLLRSFEIPDGLACNAYAPARSALRLDAGARAFRAAHLA